MRSLLHRSSGMQESCCQDHDQDFPEQQHCYVQVLAELIISNESRIIQSDSVSFYNRMRSYHFTAVIRYQVHIVSLAS